MARFIQFIGPILQAPTPGHFSFSHKAFHLLTKLLVALMVTFSFYCCIASDSILLLGVAIVQIALSLLILLESFLKKMKAGPLESRRLEMTAYCIGGVMLLLMCIYQFSEAYLSLKAPNSYRSSMVTLAVISSIAGNLLLVRLLWQSGLIRSRIRAFCRPLLGILLLNLLSLFASIFIQLTHYVLIDAGMGIITSIVLFVIAAGVMIDAYWHLAEIEMKGLKNSGLETR